MTDALTPAFATAALVLCVAGTAKLRSASNLAWALLAVVEIGLGSWCLIAPSRLAAAALCAAFGGFAIVSYILARRGAACGCFGEGEEPASGVQSVISLLLGLVGAAACVFTVNGVGWMLSRPAPSAAVIVLGVAASGYAAILAYTQLPRVWSSW